MNKLILGILSILTGFELAFIMVSLLWKPFWIGFGVCNGILLLFVIIIFLFIFGFSQMGDYRHEDKK